MVNLVLKNRERTIVETAPFVADKTVLLKIPRDNVIRRISLHVKVKVDSGATIPIGIKNGDILNIIKRIQVRLNGSDGRFDVSLKTYFEALRFEYGTKPFKTTFVIPAANADGTFYIEIPIDFAIIRNQISDYRAILPANFLASLDLLITWGDLSDIVTTVGATAKIDADSTEVSVSLIEVYSTQGTEPALDDIIKNAVQIYEGEQSVDISKKYDSYPTNQLAVPLHPLPATHLAHLILTYLNTTDGDPALSDNVVDYIKLKNVTGGGEDMFINEWEYLQRQQKLDYGLESDNLTGGVYLDWADIRNGGLNNINADAIFYQFLATAPTADKLNNITTYIKYIPLS